MSKIEINPVSNDIQADIQMIQQDIEAEGFDVTVGVSGGKIILTSEIKSELANLICEPGFRSTYLSEMSIKEAKAALNTH